MSLIFTFYFFYNYFSKYRHFKILETTPSENHERSHQVRNFLPQKIKLMTKRPADQLVFDELWINDRLYKIKITNEENQPLESPFPKKQILYIHVDAEVSEPASIPPFDKRASKILLGYQIDNKRKYCPIKDFSEILPQQEVA